MENVNLDIPLVYYHNMTFCTNFEHEDTPHKQSLLVSLDTGFAVKRCCLILLVQGTTTTKKKSVET